MTRKKRVRRAGTIRYAGKRRIRVYAPTPAERLHWENVGEYRWSMAAGPRLSPRVWLHEIKPIDFLDRAAYGTYIKREKEDWIRGYPHIQKIIRENRGIDPLTLWVDAHSCQATAHEGRHRASIAYKAGVDYMPLIIICSGYTWKDCRKCYEDFPKKIKPQFNAKRRSG